MKQHHKIKQAWDRSTASVLVVFSFLASMRRDCFLDEFVIDSAFQRETMVQCKTVFLCVQIARKTIVNKHLLDPIGGIFGE